MPLSSAPPSRHSGRTDDVSDENVGDPFRDNFWDVDDGDSEDCVEICKEGKERNRVSSTPKLSSLPFLDLPSS